MDFILNKIAKVHKELWKPRTSVDGYRIFERYADGVSLYTLNVTKTDTIDRLNFEIDGVDYSKEYREYLGQLTT